MDDEEREFAGEIIEKNVLENSESIRRLDMEIDNLLLLCEKTNPSGIEFSLYHKWIGEYLIDYKGNNFEDFKRRLYKIENKNG